MPDSKKSYMNKITLFEGQDPFISNQNNLLNQQIISPTSGSILANEVK